MNDGDRLTKPLTREPNKTEEDSGPTTPKVQRPEGGNELLKRLQRIDPDQAKKYRQRSGQ